MKFFEIGAEVLVPKFTRAEVRLPDSDLELFTYRKITQGLFKGLYNSTMELICLSDVIVRKGRSGQT